MQKQVWLVIERGEPFEIGTRLKLEPGELCLGRSSEKQQVDISFSNFLISRCHCCIYHHQDGLEICDTGSKHGTFINEKRLLSHQKYPILSGDRISLSMGVAVLRIVQSALDEVTIDLTQPVIVSPDGAGVILDDRKRECRIEGQPIPLTEKEWLFLKLLYDHANTALAYERIKQVVWEERFNPEQGIVDVGTDEMNSLVYRLRRKLGAKAVLLKSVRAYGYMLEIAVK